MLAAPTVPVGGYARATFAKLDGQTGYPPDFASAVEKNVVSNELDVKAVVTKISLGEGDAGVVYSTDVTPAVASKLNVYPFPAAVAPDIEYPIAVLKNAGDAEGRASVRRLHPLARGPGVLESARLHLAVIRVAVVGCAAALLAFIAIPLIGLVLHAGPRELAAVFSVPALTALRLSILTTSVALAITLLLGTPLAYVLARASFRAAARRRVGRPADRRPAGRRRPRAPARVRAQRYARAAPAVRGIQLSFSTAAVIMAQSSSPRRFTCAPRGRTLRGRPPLEAASQRSAWVRSARSPSLRCRSPRRR